MDLRSDRPYWPTTCRRPPLTGKHPKRLVLDALIVGAGITGALVAYHLTRAGAKVALADRRPPASGSTPASTALLQYEIDTPLVDLIAKLGKVRAERSYTLSRRALGDLVRLNRELGDGADLKPRQSLHLATKPDDLAAFRKEVAARRALGFPVRLLPKARLHNQFHIARPGAILSDEALEVNPLRLTYELLRAAREGGAVILPRTKIDLSSVKESGGPFRFSLPDGLKLIAKHLVIATGYETPEQFTVVDQLTELRSTYAITTAPVKNEPWPGSALLWEAGDPYFYARTTPDGRVMAGGEDEPFRTAAARDSMIGEKSRILMKKLRKLIPHVPFRPAYRWAGTFASTKDGLPYIGEHPHWKDVHFALGYGGNGITFSTIAAKIITASITGKPDSAGKLFGFER